MAAVVPPIQLCCFRRIQAYPNKVEPEIEVINQIVDGYFAIIPLDNNKTMYVNEEGETQSLPINDEASKIADQTVYGNVLIVG